MIAAAGALGNSKPGSSPTSRRKTPARPFQRTALRRHAKSGLSWLAAIPHAACCAGLPSFGSPPGNRCLPDMSLRTARYYCLRHSMPTRCGQVVRTPLFRTAPDLEPRLRWPGVRREGEGGGVGQVGRGHRLSIEQILNSCYIQCCPRARKGPSPTDARVWFPYLPGARLCPRSDRFSRRQLSKV
jgi:hypothetical protein